jgi:hypothetical protein
MILIMHIIALEKDRILWPDNRVGDLEVQIGFRPGPGSVCRSFATINRLEYGVCALGDFPAAVSVRNPISPDRM